MDRQALLAVLVMIAVLAATLYYDASLREVTQRIADGAANLEGAQAQLTLTAKVFKWASGAVCIAVWAYVPKKASIAAMLAGGGISLIILLAVSLGMGIYPQPFSVIVRMLVLRPVMFRIMLQTFFFGPCSLAVLGSAIGLLVSIGNKSAALKQEPEAEKITLIKGTELPLLVKRAAIAAGLAVILLIAAIAGYVLADGGTANPDMSMMVTQAAVEWGSIISTLFICGVCVALGYLLPLALLQKCAIGLSVYFVLSAIVYETYPLLSQFTGNLTMLYGFLIIVLAAAGLKLEGVLPERKNDRHIRNASDITTK